MNKLRILLVSVAMFLLTIAPAVFTVTTFPLLTSGCATTPEDKLARVRLLSYAAASIGTQEALHQNETWRPRFESAYTSLNALVENKTVTGAFLRDVLASLPVKELKSDQARIAIEGATVLYDSLVGDKVNVEAAPYIYAAATGIRDGLRVGLGK